MKVKVLGIELPGWIEYKNIWTRQSELPAYIDITKRTKRIGFSRSLEKLSIIFYQRYDTEYISHLSIEEIKQLVDQFLESMKNLEAFL